ncbi:hypothetical protein EfmAA242_09890 [Enterococcus faecium]|nr:hypothetical protein EfmAA242_09890 [Enterococcus faecium]
MQDKWPAYIAHDHTISKDTKLTNNVDFVSLDETPQEWAKKVIKEPYANKITQELKSYDVSYTTEQMESIGTEVFNSEK